jgi:hypothetical protein
MIDPSGKVGLEQDGQVATFGTQGLQLNAEMIADQALRSVGANQKPGSYLVAVRAVLRAQLYADLIRVHCEGHQPGAEHRFAADLVELVEQNRLQIVLRCNHNVGGAHRPAQP